MNIYKEINIKLENKPLIYFSREIERGIGLEDHLENYYICCIEDNYLVQELKEKGTKIFCLEERGKILNSKSVAELIKTNEVKQWLEKIAPNGFYAQAFFASGPFEYRVSELGGEVIQPKFKLQTTLENKLSQLSLFKEANINYPKSIILDTSSANYSEITEQLGESFVLQKEKSHTGNGTFFIESEIDLKKTIKEQGDFSGRFSELLNGETYTINFVVGEKHTHIGAPQLQITNIPGLTHLKGATLGNDFSYAKEMLSKNSLKNIKRCLESLGEILRDQEYIGFAGIDFIMDDELPFVLEINPRQTANASFETKLEEKENHIHLKALAIAEGMNIPTKRREMIILDGAQIFLRAPEDMSVQEPKMISGHNVFENEDIHYFLLLQKTGQTKRATDELARIQAKQSIASDDKILAQAVNVLRNTY